MFRARWEPGQHVFVYGENGSGKTDLAFRLLNTEPFAVAFITKPRDPIFTSPLTRGYKRLNAWPPRDVRKGMHALLSPKPSKTMAEERLAQRTLFPAALDNIYMDGGWTVLFDETLHMTQSLGMKQQVADFFYLGRSNNLTGLALSQRPVGIPTVVPQSCKYAFLARSRREEDIKVLAELGYSKRELSVRLSNMRSLHDFLFVDPSGKLPLMIVNTRR